MTAVDYKLLLWKYLNVVGRAEGVTFWQSEKDVFTPDELEAMQEIEDMPQLETKPEHTTKP